MSLTSTSTMASSTTPQWEGPKCSFDVPDWATEWKKFYTRAVGFLEALGIDPDKEDETKWGWHQIKMVFQGKHGQALQTLLENNTIASRDQLTPSHTLNVIQTSGKEHFWHVRDELLSDFKQEPSEDIHTMNTKITTLINSASSITSSVHKDAVTTHPSQTKCSRCGYRHPKNNCPVLGKQCYDCSGIAHFTSLCKRPRTADTPRTVTIRAGPSREYPVATDTAANHAAEADNHAEAQVEALLTHAISTGIEAPHYIDKRLATFLYHHHTLTRQKADY